MSKKMRMISCLGAVLFSLALGSAYGSLVISAEADVPDANVVIDVSSTESVLNVQTRNTASNLGDYRAIGQSFRWTSSDKLNAIGIYLDDSLGWSSGESQEYVLYFNTGTGANLSDRSTVATYNITITSSDVQTGNYLVIEGLDLALANGSWYGWQLGPAASDVQDNRLYWKASNTSYEGNSLTISGSAVPYDGEYTNSFGSIKDYTFYMQSVPEPTTGLLGAVSVGILFLFRRIHLA